MPQRSSSQRENEAIALDLRIGDAERERVIDVLNAAVGAGRLDLAEFERRVDAVYAANTAGELRLVAADLPVSSPTPQRKPGPAALASMLWGPWLATAVTVLTIWLVTSLASGHALYFWPMWVIGPWGAAMLLGVGGCSRGRAARPRS